MSIQGHAKAKVTITAVSDCGGGDESAALLKYLWLWPVSPVGRSTAELKAPEDLIVSVGIGASFLDVAVIAPTRTDPSTLTDDDATAKNATGSDNAAVGDGGASGGKKKKRKGKGGGGGGAGGGGGRGAAESMEYRVKALAGDSACGGLDMDYLVARALLVREEKGWGGGKAGGGVGGWVGG